MTFTISMAFGQISPGDLSQPHAEFEGMGNCTLCHDLGEKVSNAKCLECHKDIQSLLTQDRGYHADASVVKQDCFECHSEHHGRKFDMVRFDKENFNHDQTGYKLEGEHGQIDCKECHLPAHIQNRELKKREDTFLGLEQACLTCHDDYHQETLSQDCASCHNTVEFSPAANFDHDDTEYKLTGGHVEVDCKECHQETSKNGLDFQEFGGIEFEDCKSCHDDPHTNRIKGDCKQCHVEEAFSNFIGNNNFSHASTGFDLKGSHGDVDCFSCHAKSSNPKTVFSDRRRIDENNCVACHEDQHEGKFGNDCVKCHSERSFLTLKSMDFFDHSATDYTLEGKHLEVDCKQCHTGRFTEPIDFSACKNCHDDYHSGEFTKNGISPDCVECHTTSNGFDYSLYTLEQHQKTDFALEGAHIATPCFACHIDEENDKWTFVELGSDCIDCHENIHEGYISEQFLPENNCVSCHINDAWTDVNFDHSQTDWPLDGKHLEVNCRACHFEISENKTILKQQFESLSQDCNTCHENVHDDTFAINGVTDCMRCHVTASWFPEKFDHSTTDFPLEGRHAEIDCRECHESNDENGQTVVIYKIEKFECIDCHQ